MLTTKSITAFAAACCAVGAFAAVQAESVARPAPAQSSTARAFATEQDWIVWDVSSRIAELAGTSASRTTGAMTVATTSKDSASPSFVVNLGGSQPPIQMNVTGHIWDPDTFRPVVERMITAPSRKATADEERDFAARQALAELTTPQLLAESDRLSEALRQHPLSASVHESAALLTGAMALREASSWFNDTRSAMSRMTAYLTVARALRGERAVTPDGQLASIVLAALVGHQRQALAALDAFEQRFTRETDAAWTRALRLRITGDWRNTPQTDETLIERLEHARALGERVGMDAFLDYLDLISEDERTDWQRRAFAIGLSVEAGHAFARNSVDAELEEALQVWLHFHTGDPTGARLLRDLATPETSGAKGVASPSLQILDWTLWAGYHQRHLMQALLATATHEMNLGTPDARSRLARDYDNAFGDMPLYPVARRWLANTDGDYRDAIARAQPLVNTHPELVTPFAWTLLLTPPAGVTAAPALALDRTWFTVSVPAGTAFQLSSRALAVGAPRPPTREQIALWAQQMPYDHWTLWAREWLSVDGKPSLASVRKAFEPLLSYDATAVRKMRDYMADTPAERVEFATRLCDLTAADCETLGESQLLDNHVPEALRAFERWVAKTRNRVGVANRSTWLMRYYMSHQGLDRADALTQAAAETGSSRGMEVRGEFLDRLGRHEEAEVLYRAIVKKYPDTTTHLGIFLMRDAIATGNEKRQAEAGALLRPVFPSGAETLVVHALPATPTDGVRFETFGPRVGDLGVRRTDVIVGVDGWRVHNAAQYLAVARMSFADTMSLHIWRGGQYRSLRVRVPERWLGAQLQDYRPASAR